LPLFPLPFAPLLLPLPFPFPLPFPAPVTAAMGPVTPDVATALMPAALMALLLSFELPD
jgi:hypothetical protein